MESSSSSSLSLKVVKVGENEILACCGSTSFAKQMAAVLSPCCHLDDAILAATDIWFNKVDVCGWLEAFSAHPQIGGKLNSGSHTSETFSQWSKGEQSTAMATASSTALEELAEWNSRYKEKFGFVFLICASGRSTAEILEELKRRYSNRPIIEFEIAAQEQMKITELRLAKLFSAQSCQSSTPVAADPTSAVAKAGEDRLSMIGAHLASPLDSSLEKIPQAPKRNRPPITTHVLDVARGYPAGGIEVLLETWKGTLSSLTFPGADPSGWIQVGSGKTDKDGRSNPLMSIVDAVNPGVYRISFNTGKYYPSGFFPFVSIVFQITDAQKFEHFHVPLLLSPFGFSTYRGS